MFVRDNLWPVSKAPPLYLFWNIYISTFSCQQKIVTGLILPPVANEFHVQEPFLKLGQNIGLLVGAVFWGGGADIWGRKYVFL